MKKTFCSVCVLALCVLTQPAEANFWQDFQKAFGTKQTQTKNTKPQTPALQIINEPYNPELALPVPIEPQDSNPKSLTIIDNKPVELTKAPPSASIITTQPPQKFNEPIVQTWRARRGESLYQVLNRWSERAGTKMEWNSTSMPKLSTDVSFVGNYEDAVTHILKVSGVENVNAEFNRTQKMETSDMAGLEPIRPNLPPENIIVEDPPQKLTDLQSLDSPIEPILENAEPLALAPLPAAENFLQRVKFYALSGTSLEQALRAWASLNNFALVWEAKRPYVIKNTVSSNDSVELALQDLLAQFNEDSQRPVAKLYNDRNSQKRVLVVRDE